MFGFGRKVGRLMPLVSFHVVQLQIYEQNYSFIDVCVLNRRFIVTVNHFLDFDCQNCLVVNNDIH